MTFTIIGRCARTKQIGIGSATVSFAVGGLCFWFTSRGDVIASQAYASKRNGHHMYLAMEGGKSAESAFAIPRTEDPHIDFRQLMILPQVGAPLAFTGDKCRPYAGHIVEPDLIVAGNVLAGPHVVEAMATAFRDAADDDLDERLLRALEAGRDAGGQATPDGTALAERSASIRVVDNDAETGLPVRDLRVDMHSSAVHELRQLFEVHKVYGPYSDLRDLDPANTPAMALYEAGLIPKGGRFAARPSCYR